MIEVIETEYYQQEQARMSCRRLTPDEVKTLYPGAAISRDYGKPRTEEQNRARGLLEVRSGAPCRFAGGLPPLGPVPIIDSEPS